MRRHPFQIVCFVLAFTAALAGGSEAGERVVAIGDIHGSIDGLIEILGKTDLIDDDLRWSGGETTLIQVGDIFDRGVHVREVLDLLMRLQGEAAAAGGRVEVLLGNHESMNLFGVYRDANPGVFAEFAGEKPEKKRKKGYRSYIHYWTVRARAAGIQQPVFDSQVRENWMAQHPPGWMEYQEALGPEGIYGVWLRNRPIAVRVGEILFVHGGLGPEVAGLSLAEINQRAADELAAYDRIREYMVERFLVPSTAGLGLMNVALRELGQSDPNIEELADSDSWLLTSAEGPLWFRGAARWDEDTRADEMAALLAGVGTKRIVVGHTPQNPRRIQVRFEGTVFLIDTGMLSSHYEGGRPSALVIEEGSFSAVYPDEIESLPMSETLPEAA